MHFDNTFWLQAKSNLFLINNCFFLLEELGKDSSLSSRKDAEHYRIEGSWFVDKVNKILESGRSKVAGSLSLTGCDAPTLGMDNSEYTEMCFFHQTPFVLFT